MKRGFLYLLMIITLPVLAISCAPSNEVEGQPALNYQADKMVGHIFHIDHNNNLIEVDISAWEKRDSTGDVITDEGYSYFAQLTDETLIQDEEGMNIPIEDLKKGQKVLVNPPRDSSFKGDAEQIILLEMTYEEKYAKLLSHFEDKFNIVIMYDEAALVNMDELAYEQMFEKLHEQIEDINQRPVGAFVKYEADFVVDYKKEFGITSFPAILIFSHEELLLLTYEIEDVYDYFKEE